MNCVLFVYEDEYDNQYQIKPREMTMRKLFAIATVLVFVLGVSSVYACGEKNGSAKASRASSNSSCASNAVKSEKASVDDSNGNTVEVRNANVTMRTEKVEADNADYSNGAYSGCCVNASKAKAMKTGASATSARVCPATKDCPVPCQKETKVQNMKAEKTNETPELSKTTPSEISPVASSD
jgi:hypothetical protein